MLPVCGRCGRRHEFLLQGHLFSIAQEDDRVAVDTGSSADLEFLATRQVIDLSPSPSFVVRQVGLRRRRRFLCRSRQGYEQLRQKPEGDGRKPSGRGSLVGRVERLLSVWRSVIHASHQGWLALCAENGRRVR